MSDVSVSREIAASPEQVWDLVSDLTRMGEWSTENTGGKWVGGASGPAVGAKFRGSNQNGWRRWSTSVEVVECARGESFAFRSSVAGIPLARWAYDFEPTANGCEVTESWTNEAPGWWTPIGTLASGVKDRAKVVPSVMEATLEGLAAHAEKAAS